MTSTFLTKSQLREAEAVFLKLKNKPRSLTFYLDLGLETHREPKTDQPLADAIAAYLAERGKEVQQRAICQRQLDAIRIELALFQDYFPDRSVGELTTDRLRDYIRRENAAPRTQNNRRALLCIFCKYALAQGWLAANPLAAVKRHRVDHCRGSATCLTAG